MVVCLCFLYALSRVNATCHLQADYQTTTQSIHQLNKQAVTCGLSVHMVTKIIIIIIIIITNVQRILTILSPLAAANGFIRPWPHLIHI